MKKTKALIFLALTSCIGLSACGRPMKIETTPELKANSTLVGQGTSSYQYRVELENSSSKYLFCQTSKFSASVIALDVAVL